MKTPARSAFVGALVGLAALLLLDVGSARAESDTFTTVSAAETIHAAHLAEPLVRAAPTTPEDDLALARAVAAYERRAQPGDVASLTVFLSDHPQTGWAPAVLTNLGLLYLHEGYFSRAIDAWQKAWAAGKDATEPRARAMVDEAAGELARLYASLGQFQNLTALFAEIGDRPITGSATEAVQEAREKLSLVTANPVHLFNCGPVALKLLMLSVDPGDQRGNALQWYQAGPNGTSLAELAGLADKAKFPYRLVWRKPGQPVPVPALVHWNVGHFSTIVGKANGRYQVQDPVFPGGGLWVTQEALDAEATGYFLVPLQAPGDPGWRAASADEAAHLWGKGPTSGTQAGDNNDPTAHGGSNNCPLCGYDIKESAVDVTLSDVPVGYVPPIGPPAKVRITYNQREDSQPANFGFFNVSPKWTLNWLTYVTDDPVNPGASVSRYLPGGGAYYYNGYSAGTGRFAAQADDGSVLVLASQSPVTYRRQLRDGGVEIYTRSDGSAAYPRRIFLSQVIDPQGNALALTYDAQLRLTSLTDATGRQTTFIYDLSTQPLLVTRIADPFGRTATLTYDTSGRLSSITDILGLTSRFAYDANSLVNAMTTPYGTTSFAYTAPGAAGPPRFVQVTDPLGYHEREEWVEPASIPDSDPAATVPQGMPLPLTNQYLKYRDSFYWDRNAYVLAGCTPTGGCDYTKGRDRHFHHVPNTSIKSTSLESVKYPLENRIWYAYPGQTISIYGGTYNQPTAAGRVLDDGTTQLTQLSYDTTGYFNLTQIVDPVGRVTAFSYADQVDLAAISQATAYGVRTTIAQLTYNTHHRPVLATDAAGQTTSYGYNAAGQLTSLTDPLGHTTSSQYNASGDLTSITNANGVTAATFTYDAFDRIATYTDSEGWTVAYGYDAADRLTKVTYPDGTAETYTYDKLDLASYQDRLGRTWRYAHDAGRRLTAVTDPTGRQTLFAYNPIGEVTARTDPNGNVTAWAYDLEGRLTGKTYADSSAVAYAYESTTSRLKSATDALGQVKQ
jgi:YD repeat-containing protein